MIICIKHYHNEFDPISIIFSRAHMPSLAPLYCQMNLEAPPLTKVATNGDNSSRLALGFKQFQ
jgi:hypothetical protein